MTRALETAVKPIEHVNPMVLDIGFWDRSSAGSGIDPRGEPAKKEFHCSENRRSLLFGRILLSVLAKLCQAKSAI